MAESTPHGCRIPRTGRRGAVARTRRSTRGRGSRWLVLQEGENLPETRLDPVTFFDGHADAGFRQQPEMQHCLGDERMAEHEPDYPPEIAVPRAVGVILMEVQEEDVTRLQSVGFSGYLDTT